MTLKYKILSLLLILSVLFPTGCSTVTAENIALWAADARDAAEFGTVAALQEQPGSRVKLEKVEQGLTALLNSPAPVSYQSFVNVLNQLPVDELKSQKAQLYILGGKVVVRRVGQALQLDKINLEQARPVYVSIRDGIAAGLKTKPATP